MIDIRQLQRALHNLVTKVRDERLYGILGRREADGSRTIHNPLRPGHVFVEMDGGTLNGDVRWLGDVALRQGMRVRILVTHEGDHILEGEDYRLMEADPLAPRDDHGVRPHLHTFVALTDTPAAYTGDAGKVVKVNATEDGLEFVTGGGGAVDSVNGQVGDVVLDADNIDETATREWFTPAEATKLAGIEAGADVTDIENVTDAISMATGSAIGDDDKIPFLPTWDTVIKAITWTNLKLQLASLVDESFNAAAADTPLDADKFAFFDALDVTLNSITWANIKATLKTYLDTLYVALTGAQTVTGAKTWSDEQTFSNFTRLVRQNLTIASGVITPAASFALVTSEGGSGADDLVTIDGQGGTGRLLMIQANTGSTITLKDNTGNLRLNGDCVLDSPLDNIFLIAYGAGWLEVSRSNNQ